MIETVQRISGCALPVIEEPRRAGDPPMLIARADRLHEVFGWTPCHDDLNFILRTALDWKHKLTEAEISG
jgi:UDP-glucose 4-epimerase